MPSMPTSAPRCAGGLSSNPDATAAVEQACDQAAAGLGGASCDLAFVFASSHHAARATETAGVVRAQLAPKCLIGMSTEAVIGGGIELERAPGLAILACHLPGVVFHPFTIDAIDGAKGSEAMGAAMGVRADTRATFFFVDPFSPLVKLLPAMNRARRTATSSAAGASPTAPGPLLGGVASGGRQPGHNALFLNDQVLRSGGVGVSISGPVQVDAVVSQGCRPIGPTAVVTKAKGNVIFELAGKPTAEVMREAIVALGERAKQILGEGLLVGRVVNEYKERFGRDDFLIRNVVGLDPKSGGMAVNDLVKVGMTIRFHVRDRATASEDLAMLLDAEKLHDRPAGILLITCNARGARLFGQPNHDASAFLRAFDPPRPGEDLARGGTPIEPSTPSHVGEHAGAVASSHTPGAPPLAGCFAAGEIGPVGDAGESFLHGHTACAALFRAPM